jgi:hypothetical protein
MPRRKSGGEHFREFGVAWTGERRKHMLLRVFGRRWKTEWRTSSTSPEVGALEWG